LEEAPKVLAGTLVVRFGSERHNLEHVDRLARLLSSRTGPSPVLFEVTSPEGYKVRLKAGDKVNVTCDDELTGQIESIVGEGYVTIAPPTKQPARNNGGGGGRPVAQRGWKSASLISWEKVHDAKTTLGSWNRSGDLGGRSICNASG
jgi:hypothetical protein